MHNAAGQKRASNIGTFTCHTSRATPKQAKEPGFEYYLKI